MIQIRQEWIQDGKKMCKDCALGSSGWNDAIVGW